MNNFFILFVTCLYQYLVEDVLRSFFFFPFFLVFWWFFFSFILFWVRIFLFVLFSFKTEFLVTGAVPEFK